LIKVTVSTKIKTIFSIDTNRILQLNLKGILQLKFRVGMPTTGNKYY